MKPVERFAYAVIVALGLGLTTAQGQDEGPCLLPDGCWLGCGAAASCSRSAACLNLTPVDRIQPTTVVVQAGASGGGTWDCWPHQDEHQSSFGFDYSVGCSHGASASATGFWPFTVMCAGADTSCPSSTAHEVWAITASERSPGWCGNHYVWPLDHTSAWSVVDYNFVYVPSKSPLNTGWTASLSFGLSRRIDPSEERSVRRHAVVTRVTNESTHADLELSLVYFISAGDGSSGNYFFDPGSNQWVANLTVVDQSSASGPFRVVAREFDFGDDDFDIDEDGRFNQHDVDTLLLAIPTNDESYVSRWDFDGDGTVTGDDANVLQLLIDSGLGSGVFGDLNDDGVPDCSNIAGLIALTGHELGDNNYDVRLDYNLDGLTNQVDRSALINATCIVRGDLNCDGTVNPFDIQPFFTLLEDPTAYSAGFPGCNPLHGDASCDGTVNPFDIQPFLQCVVSRGCTCP